MVATDLASVTEAEGRQPRLPRSVWIGAILLALAIGTITLLRHWLFLSTSYDMAFYAHAISQIAAGHWTNTMFGFHIFADHFSPILVVLAPLTYVGPVEGLLLVQAVAVGSAVVPAFRLGERIAGRRVGVLAALWLGLSAAVWHTVLFDFRPATLGVVAMMWLIAEMETSSRLPHIAVLAAVAASTREDVAVLAGLAVVMFAAINHKKALLFVGAATAGVGVWFSTVGSRLFAPFDYFLWYRYADYGRSPGEVLSNLDYAIPTAVARIIREDPLVALAALIIPMLLLAPAIGLKYAWPGLLIVISNAVSADPFVPSINYQYYLAAVVFFIWGGVHGYRQKWLGERVTLAMAATIGVFFVVGPLGFILPGPYGRTVVSILAAGDRAAMAGTIADVPSNVAVSGGLHLLSHMVENPDIKPFPAPLVCSPTLLTHYPRTSYPEYVIVEESDLDAVDIELADLGYEQTRSEGGVMVWQSSGAHPASVDCPSVSAARDGLFERVEDAALR